MAARLSAAAVCARLREGDGELALLDLRERGAHHGRGHPLLASSLPLSRLELDIERMVPRRSAPVVVLDDGGEDDRAERGAETLARLGYTDVAVLDDGLAGWRGGGLEVFDGVFVPSKAFGEAVEQQLGTPHLSADALAQLSAEGADMVVLDSRPLAEFRRMSLPGAINVPGAELVHRIRDLAPRPETLVVVNCAGRTRSIIGAQSLIDAGVPNRVAALENGTMGWVLAGHALDHGSERIAEPPSESARAWARAAAARVAERHGVATVTAATLARWRDEAETHTLYLCDVRGPEEYEAGHLPGARSTPGGQLVQATDAVLAVHNARVVLIDDDGARARMTAAWLTRMGRRNVHVLDGGLDGTLETGPEPRSVLGLDPARAGIEITPAQLRGLGSATILDLADSRRHASGHIEGAWWLVRARAANVISEVPIAEMLVLTSPDSRLAHLAAPEIARLVRAPVKVLEGGTDAWIAAGLPLAQGGERMVGETDDVHLLPYDHPPQAVEAAMRAYLDWETALVPRVLRDGALSFALSPRA